jgi:hypothetical protein
MDGPTLFEVVSTGANVGGLAIGPLVSGALAQYATQPLRVPYLVFGVVARPRWSAVWGLCSRVGQVSGQTKPL